MNRLSHERLLRRPVKKLVKAAADVWCSNGHPYPSKADAKAALRFARSLPDIGKPRPVRFYRCSVCAQFHLTSQEWDQRAADAQAVSDARRAAGCVKVAYLTESAALSSLIDITNRCGRDRYPRCAYQCRHCGMYHLSSWASQPQQGRAS